MYMCLGHLALAFINELNFLFSHDYGGLFARLFINRDESIEFRERKNILNEQIIQTYKYFNGTILNGKMTTLPPSSLSVCM